MLPPAGLTVVAATPGVDIRRLGAALLDNPAGNAAQQTPLVIVRFSPTPPSLSGEEQGQGKRQQQTVPAEEGASVAESGGSR